ncbi:MAG: citramalate synthase [Chitinispirillales bacterium]|jgi:2-isopropylmalate synthase|nr:citramalate synthase [Chitinispirillales bacterium]
MSINTKRHDVDLYDTTLRDGNQALGISLSLKDKLMIAQKLDEIGMNCIEGGWPNPTNAVDTEFYTRVNKMNLKAKIAAFGSTKRPGNRVEDDPFMLALISTGAPVATIFGKSWDLHVEKVINTSLDENLSMINDSVRFLKKHFDEVVYDAEHFFDGYKANPEYALKTLLAAKDAGADCVVLCDTNGGLLPDEAVEIFRVVKSKLNDTKLGVHLHNDSGCAEASSCLCVIEGAVHVQGTMNGLGERCGNANLCTIIPNLQIKRGFNLVTPEQMKMLTSASLYVAELANTTPNVRHPYVGEAAFSHKAGAHADGVRKARESFEHINPESVGNNRQFVVSDQAGASTILEKLSNIRSGLDKKDPIVKKVLAKIKDMEAAGYQFEAADASFELIVREVLGEFKEPFVVKAFRVIEEKRSGGETYSEATIQVVEGGELEHTAAEGDGPVNALDNALRKALVKFFPSIKEVKLDDYKVRVLDGKDGTAAKVRVLIESSDKTSQWGTVGVSTDVIEASWIALVDSLMYKIMKDAIINK